MPVPPRAAARDVDDGGGRGGNRGGEGLIELVKDIEGGLRHGTVSFTRSLCCVLRGSRHPPFGEVSVEKTGQVTRQVACDLGRRCLPRWAGLTWAFGVHMLSPTGAIR